MLLYDVAVTSRSIAAESSRLGKIRLLAESLGRCAPEEVPIVVAQLSGELPQRQIGVGPAALRETPPPAAEPRLTVREVDALLSRIKAAQGQGSQRQRRILVRDLFAAATEIEQRFLGRLLLGELRQGALDAVMADAVAHAAGVPAPEVRRALMLRGAAGPVAEAALAGGVEALSAFGLEVGRPIRPMLAASAPDMAGALSRLQGGDSERTGIPVALEWKLDGVRVQIHRLDQEVRVFTRSLDDVTARLPELVEAAHALPVRSVVLDGEAIALRADGRPHPFQVTAARAAGRDAARRRTEVPLTVYLFDILAVDGRDLLDLPGEQRWAALQSVAPSDMLVPRLVTGDRDHADAFFSTALAHGHEGVIVKSLDTPYTAGRRGAGWIKVKPRHTLDLVVLAAEWGHGRRRGKLSNLHLAARDPDGGWVMLGKTFKGLTDELLAWQTDRLLALAESQDDWVVRVRPELVVEIACDGLQRSPRYPAGLALRFARVLRYRPDKRANEADTIDTVRALAVTEP